MKKFLAVVAVLSLVLLVVFVSSFLVGAVGQMKNAPAAAQPAK